MMRLLTPGLPHCSCWQFHHHPNHHPIHLLHPQSPDYTEVPKVKDGGCQTVVLDTLLAVKHKYQEFLSPSTLKISIAILLNVCYTFLKWVVRSKCRIKLQFPNIANKNNCSCDYRDASFDLSRIPSYPTAFTLQVVIIAGVQHFEMVSLHFVNVRQGVINTIAQNTILRNAKNATKFGVTLQKKKMNFLPIELCKPDKF